MKIFRIACLCVVLVFVPLAVAKLAMPNGLLGKVEGALDFCAQTDAQSASKYEEKKKAFVQGASREEVAEARSSQEYKDNYQSTTDELATQSKDEAKKSCADALAGKS